MELKVGTKVPGFTGINDDGEVFDATLWIGKKPFVIYFYPKNFTPGCTKEACSFRDHYEDFKEMGMEVIGVSNDSLHSHQKFKKRYQLPFMFLSDKNGKLRRLFGIKSGLFGFLPGRETFVIDKQGIIKLKFNSMNASRHLGQAMKVAKQLVNE